MLYLRHSELDQIDLNILQALQENGRISNLELASRINLSPPATHTRVKKLEDQGFIRQYVALLDRDKLGYDLVCFLNVSILLRNLDDLNIIRRALIELPEVLECYHVTGQADFILKVVVRGHTELEHFITEKLLPIRNIASTNTSIVLAEFKSTTALPLQASE